MALETPTPSGFGDVPMIDSAEELDALLSGSSEGTDGDGDGNGDDGNKPPEGANKNKPADVKPAAKPAAASPFNTSTEGDDDSDGDGDGDGTGDAAGKGDEKQYGNLVEYINDKHNLGLNIAELPKDLTKEQEAEVLSKVYEQIIDEARGAVGYYENIAKLLDEDEDVRFFLEAKAKGKSLRDIAADYSATIEGMSSDQLVLEDFKSRYPNLKEDVLNKLVEGAKKSGEFEVIAESIRETRKKEAELSAQQEAVRATKQREIEEQQYAQSVQAFQQKLSGIKNVYGVPLDDQMRGEIFAAATQRDREGRTYLDRALQSDEGVMLATLGLLHLEKLVSAKASVKANKRNKSFIEKVFDSPDRLQSGSNSGGGEEEFDIQAVNRF